MATTRINRVVQNTRRHTIGYVVTGGKTITRDQAVRYARRGQLAGVRVVEAQTPYLQSTGKRSLQDLPIVIDEDAPRGR